MTEMPFGVMLGDASSWTWLISTDPTLDRQGTYENIRIDNIQRLIPTPNIQEPCESVRSVMGSY